MAIRCWASAHSLCGGGQSHELLISKGLFESKMTTVQGFDWCPNEPVTVSVANLTANILCRQHNSLSSLVDDGGIDAYRAFLGAEHSAGTKPFASAADGLILERWLLRMSATCVVRCT